MTTRKKRGYSRAFTPHRSRHHRYLLDRIPTPLWRAVRRRCRERGVSVRATLLALVADWTFGDQTHVYDYNVPRRTRDAS